MASDFTARDTEGKTVKLSTYLGKQAVLLDFCAAKNILPETETIAIQDINHAYERMERSDVKYRFVIDMASLKRETAKGAGEGSA